MDLDRFLELTESSDNEVAESAIFALKDYRLDPQEKDRVLGRLRELSKNESLRKPALAMLNIIKNRLDYGEHPLLSLGEENLALLSLGEHGQIPRHTAANFTERIIKAMEGVEWVKRLVSVLVIEAQGVHMPEYMKDRIVVTLLSIAIVDEGLRPHALHSLRSLKYLISLDLREKIVDELKKRGIEDPLIKDLEDVTTDDITMNNLRKFLNDELEENELMRIWFIPLHIREEVFKKVLESDVDPLIKVKFLDKFFDDVPLELSKLFAETVLELSHNKDQDVSNPSICMLGKYSNNIPTKLRKDVINRMLDDGIYAVEALENLRQIIYMEGMGDIVISKLLDVTPRGEKRGVIKALIIAMRELFGIVNHDNKRKIVNRLLMLATYPNDEMRNISFSALAHLGNNIPSDLRRGVVEKLLEIETQQAYECLDDLAGIIPRDMMDGIINKFLEKGDEKTLVDLADLLVKFKMEIDEKTFDFVLKSKTVRGIGVLNRLAENERIPDDRIEDSVKMLLDLAGVRDIEVRKNAMSALGNLAKVMPPDMEDKYVTQVMDSDNYEAMTYALSKFNLNTLPKKTKVKCAKKIMELLGKKGDIKNTAISVLVNFNVPKEYKKDMLEVLIREEPSPNLIKAISKLRTPEFDDEIFSLLVRSIEKSSSAEVQLIAMRVISGFIPQRESEALEKILLKLSWSRNKDISREALSLLSRFKDTDEVKERIIHDASEASKIAFEMGIISYDDIGEEINRLIKLAKHEDFEKRMEVSKIKNFPVSDDLKDIVKKTLLDLCKDKELCVRRSSAIAFKEIGFRLHKEIIEDSEGLERVNLLECSSEIKKNNKEMIEELLNMTEGEDITTRCAAINALDNIHSVLHDMREEVKDRIIKLSKDKNPLVRSAALSSLGDFRGDDVAEALLSV
ncbi:MAG: hypothetical protein A7316_08300 [Candidatus Altiarchaeales archaeon WOR_SM1_86-2]|nr:MAG: hypothetical protein A7316_08300 [Candidatus Altiarchaeales archaeon WOR_SM1_86-2]